LQLLFHLASGGSVTQFAGLEIDVSINQSWIYIAHKRKAFNVT